MIYIPSLGWCDEIGCQAEVYEAIACGPVDILGNAHLFYCEKHAIEHQYCLSCGDHFENRSAEFPNICAECIDYWYTASQYDDEYDPWFEDEDGWGGDPYYEDEQYDDDYFDWEH